MKAVIVDLRGNQAAAMDETGVFVRIPNKGYQLGQQVEIHRTPVKRPSLLRRSGPIAAAAALALCICSGTAYAMPYGTVQLSADPAIEYTINCFDYVLNVRPLNEEAEVVLTEIDPGSLRNRPVTKAVLDTVDQIKQDGYLEKDGAPEVEVSTGTKSESHSRRLQRKLEEDLHEKLHSSEDLPTEPEGAETPADQKPPLTPDQSETNTHPDSEAQGAESKTTPEDQKLETQEEQPEQKPDTPAESSPQNPDVSDAHVQSDASEVTPAQQPDPLEENSVQQPDASEEKSSQQPDQAEVSAHPEEAEQSEAPEDISAQTETQAEKSSETVPQEEVSQQSESPEEQDVASQETQKEPSQEMPDAEPAHEQTEPQVKGPEQKEPAAHEQAEAAPESEDAQE